MDFQAVPLEEPTHRLTLSELQHLDSSLKGTSGIRQGTEVSGIKARAGTHISPRLKSRQRPLPLFWTLSPENYRASKWGPYLRLLQLGWYPLPCPGDPLRLCATQLMGPLKLLTETFPYELQVLAHNFLNPPKQAIAGLSEPQAQNNQQ